MITVNTTFLLVVGGLHLPRICLILLLAAGGLLLADTAAWLVAEPDPVRSSATSFGAGSGGLFDRYLATTNRRFVKKNNGTPRAPSSTHE